ncbi:hypothetical protein [Nocardiopsis alborubida]|uniref:Lipoprotein n=1 Tax=Nocardiopsis alborubida TaxID=146802 RepID=A0A7X6RTN2_9ACTN|nr:hypothetical protein [Nocardiopsis alborubida]NKZ01472.1 hypothetical protein [Nocardiopsis alborubida]
MHPIRLTSAFLLVALAVTGCGSSEPTDESETQAAGAMCEDHVERQPEVSATTESVTFVRATANDDGEWWTYEAVGSYDTEGGSHTDYTCTVVNDSGDWVVVDLRSAEQ